MRDSNKTSVILRILPALLVAALLVPGCVVRPYHPHHKKVVVHHPHRKKVIVHRPHKQVVVQEHKNEVTVVHVKGHKKGHKKHGDDHPGKGKGHDDD